MKNKFNSILIHKILPILAIFLLCINIFTAYSFAIDVSYENRTYQFEYPSSFDDFTYKILLLRKSYDNYYFINCIGANSPFIFSQSSSYTFKTSDGSLVSLYHQDRGSQSLSVTFSDFKNGLSCYLDNPRSSASIVADRCDIFIIHSTHNILDKEGNVVFKKPFNNPNFVTSKEELVSGKFDILKIDAGDLDYADDKFVFNIYKGISLENNLYDYSLYKSILLDSSSSYLHAVDLHLQYYIPQEKLGIDLSNGKNYMFELKEKGGDTVYSSVSFTISGLTEGEEIKNSQDVTNDKLDEQTNAIKDQTEATKEQTEVNKNIFEKIGDILSYINPFSENFFVYKLIELLVDAIKSLFIPSDDFFGNYFNELKDWFSDRLGFLFYPFELIIDILNKILSINFSEPIFNVPDISEPFTGSKLISATTFNLSSLLENGIFNTVHEIYFICVDAFITFKLVNLFKRKYEEVTEK